MLSLILTTTAFFPLPNIFFSFSKRFFFLAELFFRLPNIVFPLPNAFFLFQTLFHLPNTYFSSPNVFFLCQTFFSFAKHFFLCQTFFSFAKRFYPLPFLCKSFPFPLPFLCQSFLLPLPNAFIFVFAKRFLFSLSKVSQHLHCAKAFLTSVFVIYKLLTCIYVYIFATEMYIYIYTLLICVYIYIYTTDTYTYIRYWLYHNTQKQMATPRPVDRRRLEFCRWQGHIFIFILSLFKVFSKFGKYFW